MHRLDWDDLRYALAVAETGSLSGAARTLGVNHTTVLRRINAFEERLGLRLFERSPAGYAATAGGEELLLGARSVSETVMALERRLAGRDLRLSGTLRVTTTDTLVATILPRLLAAFRAAHPGVRIELAVSNQIFNLTKRDADVAIRPTREPPETLIGRRIAPLAFAVYAAPDYLARRVGVAELRDHVWIGLDDSLAQTVLARWMRKALPEAEIVMRTDSLVAMRNLAMAGMGVAALPCYLGDTCESLTRVTPPIATLATELWILTHEDLRASARVRAFMEVVGDALGRERDLFEGKRSRPTGQ